MKMQVLKVTETPVYSCQFVFDRFGMSLICKCFLVQVYQFPAFSIKWQGHVPQEAP